MIRIVLAEDQNLLRGALGALLDLEEDMTVVGQAENGAEALELVAAESPDVCLMDIEMPVMTGLEAAERLKGRVMQSHHADDLRTPRIFRTGEAGAGERLSAEGQLQ